MDLLARMRYFLDHERNAEVEFLVGKNQDSVAANAGLFAAASDVYEKMFFNDRFCKKGNERYLLSVEEPESTVEDFLAFKRFIYTDEIDLTEENALSLLQLADKYAVMGLRWRAVDFIKCHLSVENVLEMLCPPAGSYPDLKEACLRFIDHRADQVFRIYTPFSKASMQEELEIVKELLARDSLAVSETTLYYWLLQLAQCRCIKENRPTSGRNCRELLQGAIELIRFPLMPLNELTELTRIREILTSEEFAQIADCIQKKSTACEPFNATPRSGPFLLAEFIIRRCRKCVYYHAAGDCGHRIYNNAQEWTCRCGKVMMMPVTAGHTTQCDACGDHLYRCNVCEANNAVTPGNPDQYISDSVAKAPRLELEDMKQQGHQQ
ncbi:hypothetical protein AAVH_23129 [Aphelenchoides avenae]|nr:hypothetical protein AAVH_23129 [Aphelenchus avenae]